MSPVHILLLLLASVDHSFAISIGISRNRGRSFLRAITDTDLPDVAVELNNSNFDPFLRESLIPFAIVELFSHGMRRKNNPKKWKRTQNLYHRRSLIYPMVKLGTKLEPMRR